MEQAARAAFREKKRLASMSPEQIEAEKKSRDAALLAMDYAAVNLYRNYKIGKTDLLTTASAMLKLMKAAENI